MQRGGDAGLQGQWGRQPGVPAAPSSLGVGASLLTSPCAVGVSPLLPAALLPGQPWVSLMGCPALSPVSAKLF